MLLTNSMLLGFTRLCLLVLLLFYLNRKLVNQSESNDFVAFLVSQWFRYGSITGLVLFVTIQIGIYNLLNCILILLTIIAIDSIGFRNLKNIKTAFRIKVKSILHQLLKGIEGKQSIFSYLGFQDKGDSQTNSYFLFFLIVAWTVITFISRYYFFKYDLYSLSNIWISDLEKVIDFDSQNWFSEDINEMGHLAFVNFYAKITDVSPEIALQSMGIVVSVLITIILFWLIRTITTSKILAPLIAAFSFALLYTITPVNIDFLLQSKATIFALTFAIPAMVFLIKTSLLKLNELNCFFSFLVVFVIIGLIDLFTLYVLLPPFLIISGFLTTKETFKYYWIIVFAFCLAALLILGIYAWVCFYFQTDLKIFLHTHFLSVNNYTYIPQLVIPLNRLITFYLLSAGIGIVFLLKLTFYNKEDWKGAIAFLLYFISLIFLAFLKNSWIDFDLIIQSLPVFIPIVIGINTAIITRLFRPWLVTLTHLKKYAIIVLVFAIPFFTIYYQRNSISKFGITDKIPKQILDAYDQISTTYYPYSYAVVNSNTMQVLSKNKHFFMNYSFFLKDYLKQDAIYFKNKHHPLFFKKNPQYVIPKSVLLFVFKKESLSNQLITQLNVLKKRGRTIQLFYKNENFKVYEIVNEPKSSKISDLIF